jgi:hypothetical protein
MPQAVTKARIVQAIEALPEDATLEDAMERLLFLHRVETGWQQARDGKTATLDEVEARLKRRRQHQHES